MRGPEVNWHLVGASFGTRKHTTRRRFTSEPGTRAHGQPRSHGESGISARLFLLLAHGAGHDPAEVEVLSHRKNRGVKSTILQTPGTWADMGGMAGPLGAQGTRNVPRTFSPRVSGNGWSSGNAKTRQGTFSGLPGRTVPPKQRVPGPLMVSQVAHGPSQSARLLGRKKHFGPAHVEAWHARMHRKSLQSMRAWTLTWTKMRFTHRRTFTYMQACILDA